MKAYLFVVALAVSSACGKQNDAQLLQHEVATLEKYYRPRVELLEQRMQAIFQRGQTIRGDAPGVEDVGRRLAEVRDQITRLRDLFAPTPPDQKSALQRRSEAALKDNKLVDLQRVVHDAEVQLENGLTAVNANLNTIEAWIAQYDAKTLAALAPTRSQQGEQTGNPETQNTPVTGQPPAAAQPAPEGTAQPGAAGGATAAPAGGGDAAAKEAAQPGAKPAAAQPKVDAKQPAQPKAPAAQPKADAKQPAPKADAKPAAQPKAPAPAQPKMPAPAQPKAPAQ